MRTADDPADIVIITGLSGAGRSTAAKSLEGQPWDFFASVDTDHVPTVPGDRARLAQLANNLLSNAIKFTPDGGRVEVRGHENRSNAVIEIRDSGIGIPADEIPRLFSRFYRATSATEHAISGTGLGLAIVKSIADAHHGAIEVDSSPGVGTTMRVLLPLSANEN